MRVGLLHLGQSVDFVVSITFLRSPVFAIFGHGSGVSPSWGCLCTHPPRRTASTARSFAASIGNGIAWKKRDSLLPVYIKRAWNELSCGWLAARRGRWRLCRGWLRGVGRAESRTAAEAAGLDVAGRCRARCPGLALGWSSGFCLGNCTGFITPTLSGWRRSLVLSVGSFSPGLRKVGGAAGACVSGLRCTSPISTVRVCVASPEFERRAVGAHHPVHLVLGEDHWRLADFGNLHANHAVAIDADKVHSCGRLAVDPLLKGHLAIHFARSCSPAALWRTAPCPCSCPPAHGGREWHL